ncbi:type II secretion system ATPase GspE [Sansalvadorimonas sp. 2012CJ34-2]|uniref:Type II secretion system protein E n=1 Tax=Parendozoicomonas callyspongiae TaxID=2942213 RepID=A0ABT0PBK7_9GAMM|nr:type II secretion system ATPase GspE [Sansalvadorimonas sp. 2012CJ34-2]MCL6268739.1 type II secretion system ATPase GspE [Sansalvadorimonas sp. 2012CJ34-2]
MSSHHTTMLPFSFANRFKVVVEAGESGPVLSYEGKIHHRTLMEVRRVLGVPFKLQQLSEEEFARHLGQVYQQDSSAARQLMNDIGSDEELQALADELPDSEDLLEADDGAPIIRMINAMLSESIRDGASDIHIETFENQLVIRFRIDGVLREILRPQRKLAALLVSRIKVMAKLDIAEKRIPQDGRISLKLGGRAIDVRVSTMPTRHGERIVLRLLDRSSIRFDLGTLGMSAKVCEGFREQLHKPHGILLVTGPTGSGKSTTLYSGISEINTPGRNIMTVEDPVEYDLEGIGQTQVNTKVDMTFARGLRAILRQDPDVVMIGEIRDLETAEIAVQASLTGHLVLSTLHTNTAVGAITRLRDMGIEPFLLSSSLLGVLAQRLVRTLCPDCKTPVAPTDAERQMLNIPEGDNRTIWKADGCSECRHTGYRGRTGIYELFLVNDDLRQMIHDGKGEPALERTVRQQWQPIQQDGFDKVLKGITTLSEVLRVTRDR